MVVVAAVVGYYKYIGPDKASGGEVPILGLEDAVRPEPGARPMRILSEDARGIYVENPLGPPILVPEADLTSGKAVRITGIRKAIEVKFLVKKATDPYPYTIEEVNPTVGKQCEKQALELYRVRNMADKPAALFGAVRLFQKALAYNGGRGYFEDSAVDKVYRQSLDELLQTITRLYSNAAGPEEKSDPKRALETYKRILNMLPEQPEIKNPIIENVSHRMAQLKRSMPEAK
jgi:signal recognition particle subunit SEC65